MKPVEPAGSLPYRRDIDGLRALAVLGVVIHHAGLGLPGGFVGVDVFFVISGFLITSIIARELEAGRFSLVGFWERRVRRILPAVVVLLIGCTLIGSLLLTRDDYTALQQAVWAQLFLYANHYYAQDAGYFAPDVAFWPLLHTWSLAVEEQFYLVLPVLMLLVARWWKGSFQRAMPWVLAAVCLGSFAWSTWAVVSEARGAFYFLQYRAWELGLGGCLALFGKEWPKRRATREGMAGLGLGLILASYVGIEGELPFPGPLALLPVGAAMMLIQADRYGTTIVGRLLSLPVLVGIGLISYSLYLWHWPLLVFSRFVVYPLPWWAVSLVLVASFGAAYVSWRWIEQPIRKRKMIRGRRLVFTGAAVAVAAAMGVTLLPRMGPKLPPHYAELQRDIEWRGLEYAVEPYYPVGPKRGRVDFAVWGDSHGLMFSETIRNAAEAHNLRGELSCYAGVAPLPNFLRSWKSEARMQENLERWDAALRRVVEQDIAHVILIGRWTSLVDARNPDYNDAWPDRVSTASPHLAYTLSQLIQALEHHGTKIWLIEQVPESGVHHAALRMAQAYRRPRIVPPPEPVASLDDHRAQRSEAREVFDFLGASYPASVFQAVDPTMYFTDDDGKVRLHDGHRSFYCDNDHITSYGAELTRPMWDRIFDEIRASRSTATPQSRTEMDENR
ncbi:MAG: acyltransferase family protein [Planctomycetota bacterium]